MQTTYEEAVLQIKDRIDILEIVSEEVILKKSGTNYWGLCPFHGEKTPSFSVNPSRGIFKCFGCGVGGDAIAFLEKIHNWDYNQTIRHLADKYNIELPEFKSKEGSKELRENLVAASRKATDFYKNILMNESSSSSSLKYLEKRGITLAIIDKYGLGLALKESNLLYKSLKKDFPDDILEKAGLVLKSNQGGYIDRFKNRIIIPIQDEKGDYVAFGARAVEEGQNPKYLNSSDSLIYNKSRLLYGLYNAKEAIKAEDSVIIMEGYFDVISAQAHGIKNIVASCGTSLTLEHVKLLSKYMKSRRIFLSFDTDRAGQNATARGGELIKTAFQGLGNIKQFDESHIATNDDKYACEIRVIAPPDGKDPDEFIRTFGSEVYKNYVNKAPLLLDYQLNELLKKKSELKTPIDKSNFVKEVIFLLKEVQNEIIRSEYIKSVSTIMDIDEQALIKEVQKTLNMDIYSSTIKSKINDETITLKDKIEKNLMCLYLVENIPFMPSEINEKIKSVEISNETLIIVKDTIDKLVQTVNNVRELTDRLYVKFSENKEIQGLIADLICISEQFNGLQAKDFQSIIDENIDKLNQYKRNIEEKELKNLYKSANEDETEALKLQMQLRDKINKQRTGDNV